MKNQQSTPHSPKREADSLRKRYSYKLFTNVLIIPISVMMHSIIPRALGPQAYGQFSFLTNFFIQVSGFLDSGTSLAFYTKLCQRQSDQGLVRFYWGFVALISALMALIVLLIHAIGYDDRVWLNQDPRYVVFALFWGLMFWWTQIVNKMVDAYGLTVPGELIRLVARAIGLGTLAAFFFLNSLDLTTLFLIQYFIFCLMAFLWWRLLCRHNRQLIPRQSLKHSQLRGYAAEFYNYAMPLLVYSLVGVVATLLDRWLLERYAGSVQQGFYGLSFQIGAIAILFASALTPLFTREISIAFEQKDEEAMRRLFNKVIPLLYGITAIISIFFYFQATTISHLIGGSDYDEATLAISIMALYPIHQTLGQMNGSLFYATGRTKLYRNIGIPTMIFGIGLAAVFILPQNMGGLELGASGLAMKMVIFQFIAVNIQLWFNTRYLRISFGRLFLMQFTLIAAIAPIALIATNAGNAISTHLLLSFSLSSLIYFILIGGMVWLVPSLFSITSSEIASTIKSLRHGFGKK